MKNRFLMKIQAAQHLLGSLAMHQVEGDLGGGVNISANLVIYFPSLRVLELTFYSGKR